MFNSFHKMKSILRRNIFTVLFWGFIWLSAHKSDTRNVNKCLLFTRSFTGRESIIWDASFYQCVKIEGCEQSKKNTKLLYSSYTMESKANHFHTNYMECCLWVRLTSWLYAHERERPPSGLRRFIVDHDRHTSDHKLMAVKLRIFFHGFTEVTTWMMTIIPSYEAIQNRMTSCGI